MNKLNLKNKAGRGLGRMMTMIAGVAAFMMVAGSAQALSIDFSSYRGGSMVVSAGDHTISVSQSRSRWGQSISITVNDGQNFSVNSVEVGLRAGRGVLVQAGDESQVVRRGWGNRRAVTGTAEFDGEETDEISLFSWSRIRLGTIDIDIPNRPGPVTAVPEPGAAMLFGAGILLAGLRRR